MVLIIGTYAYSREGLVKSKQMDLNAKSPIFTRLNQTTQGLTQIHLFGSNEQFMDKLYREANASVRTSYQSYFMVKGMDATVAVFNYVGIVVGLFIGIRLIKDPANYFLYAFCLLATLFAVFWSFVMVAGTENWLVSASRCLRITEIPS